MRGPKHAFGRTPAKGTRLRAMLLAMLRPEGLTNVEAEGLGYGSQRVNVAIEQLRNDKGWDVRTFPLPRADPRFALYGGRRPPVVHRVVGRMRWDGSYRSFVDPSQSRGPLRRP